MLPTMAAVRLAAFLPFVLVVAASAQTTSTTQVTVTVVDQSGARIPRARVAIISLPAVLPNELDWLNFASTAPEQAAAQTDAFGEATFGVAK